MISFSRYRPKLIKKGMDPYAHYRRMSKGYSADPVARVHPNIMFGPGIYLSNPDFVKKNGITHVINCATWYDTNPNIPVQLGDNYTCLNAVDSTSVDITQWYPAFECSMDKYLRDNTCNIVYVHCQAGINRSGFLTVLYCCKRFGYDFDLLIKAILMQRPCALMNGVFNDQVKQRIKNND